MKPFASITPSLIIGRTPRSTEQLARIVSAAGVDVVLSLGDGYRAWTLPTGRIEAWCQQLELAHVRVEFDVLHPESLASHLEVCVSALEASARASKRVLAHCSLGLTTSPTVAVAYLCWALGMSQRAAMAHVLDRYLCVPDVIALRAATARRNAPFARPHDGTL